jgi:hypothetical protein
VRGARNWAKGALAYAQAARFMQPALVNGAVGLILAPRGRLLRVLTFEFDDGGRSRAAEVISNPARLATLDLAVLAGSFGPSDTFARPSAPKQGAEGAPDAWLEVDPALAPWRWWSDWGQAVAARRPNGHAT